MQGSSPTTNLLKFFCILMSHSCGQSAALENNRIIIMRNRGNRARGDVLPGKKKEILVLERDVMKVRRCTRLESMLLFELAAACSIHSTTTTTSPSPLQEETRICLEASQPQGWRVCGVGREWWGSCGAGNGCLCGADCCVFRLDKVLLIRDDQHCSRGVKRQGRVLAGVLCVLGGR